MSVESLLTQVLSRLSAIEAKIGGSSGDGDSKSGGTPAVEAFDDYLAQTLQPFTDACSALGGDCAQSGALLAEAWQEMRSFIVMASLSKEPAQSDLMSLLSGVAGKMKAVGANVKRGDFERHTKALSEGVSAMNWVCVKPAPKDIVETALDGYTFLANKIRMEFKGKDDNQIAFCDAGKALFSGLVEYVKTHHKVGLKWNPQGGNPKEYKSGSAPAPKTAAAPAPKTVTTSASAGTGADKSALFGSLNAGLDITSGLKKVTKDMKSSNLPPAASVVAKAPVAPRVNNNKVKGPPKCELGFGGKWAVENQDGHCEVEITNSKQVVYIYGCIGANIVVKGKCKTITVDSCKQCKISFEDIMASFEVVNSQRSTCTANGVCPAIALDKVDGCVVFCSKEALGVEFSCSKISECNVQWMDSAGELVEKPIPEQYVHRIKDGAITVAVSDLYSS
jgi:adenylyl cyclase-associated protein